MILEPELVEQGGDGPVLVWRFAPSARCASTAVLGGGLGPRAWVVNATVPLGYRGADPAADAAALAGSCGVGEAPGVGLLTGVDVRRFVARAEAGAEVVATVGLGAITWAAAPDGGSGTWAPGTVNVVAWVPEPLADAALVNLVATVTEAKVQAFGDAGVPATGTPTDAVVVCCPSPPPVDDDAHRYGGPRSTWGARVARAAHAAILAGITR